MMRRTKKKVPAVYKTMNRNASVGYTTTLANTIPATAVVGETLHLIAVLHNSTISTPAGWTLKASYADAGYGGTAYHWTRVCQAGDAGTNVNLTGGGSGGYMAAVCFIYTLSSGVVVEAGADTSAGGSSWIAPSVNATRAGARIVCVWLCGGADFSGQAMPAGVTQRAKEGIGTSGTIIIGDFLSVSAGATGNKVYNPGGGSAASMNAWQIQL